MNMASTNQNSNICKFIKFTPIIIVHFVILITYYTYLKYYIFDYNSTSSVKSSISIKKSCLLILCTLIVFMILLCHTLCVFTNPGGIKNKKINEIHNFEFCDKCNLKRPLRSHHCHSCGCCILKMDHHCHWISNCVGLNNHKYFYLFLFYSALGCVITFSGLIWKFLEIDEIMIIDNLGYYNESYILLDTNSTVINSDNHNNNSTLNIKHFENPFLDPLLIITSTVFSILIFISVFILFCIQTYILLNNMTTIEFNKYKQREKCPFYISTSIKNLKIVLGGNIFMWFIPYSDVGNDVYNNYYGNMHIDIEDKEVLI